MIAGAWIAGIAAYLAGDLAILSLALAAVLCAALLYRIAGISLAGEVAGDRTRELRFYADSGVKRSWLRRLLSAIPRLARTQHGNLGIELFIRTHRDGAMSMQVCVLVVRGDPVFGRLAACEIERRLLQSLPARFPKRHVWPGALFAQPGSQRDLRLMSTITHFGDRIRVYAELIEVYSGKSLFRLRYQTLHQELESIIAEITKCVAASIDSPAALRQIA